MEPVIVSTWEFGERVNQAAWPILVAGGSALDACEAGVNVAELDPTVVTVGKGGLPNADGVVELDAAICWAPTRGVGAVAGLRGVVRAVSVARAVMERSPHCMLVGEGARRFALAHGFEEENLLSAVARRQWEAWRADPDSAVRSHDTIGALALDSRGDLCAATSTSGLAWKLPGRVGDSPLIGSGLYADNGVGAAAATGVGEYILRYCAAFHIVESMRAGATPQQACERFIRWMVEDRPEFGMKEVAVIALSRDGATGAASTKPGFPYAVTRAGETTMREGPHPPQF